MTAEQMLEFIDRHLDLELTPWQKDYVRRVCGAPRADVVHVITELGPTDGAGLVVQAQLGRVGRPRIDFSWPPYIDEWARAYGRGGRP